MENVMFQLTQLVPYFLIFPCVAFVMYVVFLIVSGRKINNKNMMVYGLFMSMDKKSMLLISLLITHFIIILESLFVMEFSPYSLILIFAPIVIFDIIKFRMMRMPIDIAENTFICFLIYFKNIFYSYMNDTTVSWYMLMLFVAVCAFIIVFSTFTFTSNINYLVREKEF